MLANAGTRDGGSQSDAAVEVECVRVGRAESGEERHDGGGDVPTDDFTGWLEEEVPTLHHLRDCGRC